MALKTLFKKGGFTYQLVKRIENFAIYTQKKEGYSFGYYEVIKIQVVKNDVKTKFMDLKAGDEFYPSTNQWGSSGWTCKTLEQAERKINGLITAK